MSENPITLTKLLSVGNVVSASIRIYRDNFKSYFGVAIRATLWFLLPFLVLIPVPLILAYGQANISNSIFLLLITVWLLLFIYCTAKSIVNSAIIGRLVFGILANQPETVREVRRSLAPKIWSFLWAFFLFYLIVILVPFILLFLMSFIGGIIITILGLSVNNNDLGSVILGSTFLAILFIVLAILLARFFILEIPLAVEEVAGATKTLGRSWELTKGYVRRIFIILVIAGLITLPVGIILQIFTTMLQGILLLAISPTQPIDATNPNIQFLSFLLGYAIGLLGNVFLLPFWQAIKAVVYYDLRTRREGIDLQLRKQDI
ncbi:MAG: DUF975 domain-containing protein [Okeania sp. SIO2C2]|uniref:hypothetical protein n=2 Tax=Okeania TaxID=1458928 RepID=UPI0013BCD915|nr:hypothetical protein [Okeania sp. SIO2C2]NEP86181.1 DUF975 domain-containing protein [Okeania sp. SIO2C2]